MNLTPTVSHLVVLDAADIDIRYPRTVHMLRLDPVTLHPIAVPVPVPDAYHPVPDSPSPITPPRPKPSPRRRRISCAATR